jgi:hypothetical protein
MALYPGSQTLFSEDPDREMEKSLVHLAFPLQTDLDQAALKEVMYR